MKLIEEKQINRQLEKVLHLKKENLAHNDVTIETLYKCRNIMAKIIKEDGDVFLPIFIRIEKEIKEKEKNDEYKNIALQIAENS